MPLHRTIPRRQFLQSALLTAGSLSFTRTGLARSKPNFVLIVADDLGYGDIGCYGNTINQTPNLDRMALEGMRFSDFHSNGPMCSPTRASLLTGRYQQRLRIEGPLGQDEAGLGKLDEITLAARLKNAGYATGIFGKWHLGALPTDNPIHHGFSEFRGHMDSAVDYQSHVNRWGKLDWWNNDKLQNENGYNTHLITKHAVQFIENHKDEPFFLYVPHSAIHFPWMAPNDPAYREVGKDYSDLSKLGPHKNVSTVVKQMVEEVDTSVGQILTALKNHGLEDNTLVFFTSDNGGYRHYAGRHQGEVSDNGPLRGQKTDVFEGGHRVPAIAHWPGRVNAGTLTNETAMTMDIMPTFLELAGQHLPKPNSPHALDGISISSVLFKQEKLDERTLFIRMKNDHSVRKGPWKMVWLGDTPPMLFNLDNDLSEQHNIADQHPEIVNQLKSALLNWEQNVDKT